MTKKVKDFIVGARGEALKLFTDLEELERGSGLHAQVRLLKKTNSNKSPYTNALITDLWRTSAVCPFVLDKLDAEMFQAQNYDGAVSPDGLSCTIIRRKELKDHTLPDSALDDAEYAAAASSIEEQEEDPSFKTKLVGRKLHLSSCRCSCQMFINTGYACRHVLWYLFYVLQVRSLMDAAAKGFGEALFAPRWSAISATISANPAVLAGPRSTTVTGAGSTDSSSSSSSSSSSAAATAAATATAAHPHPAAGSTDSSSSSSSSSSSAAATAAATATAAHPHPVAAAAKKGKSGGLVSSTDVPSCTFGKRLSGGKQNSQTRKRSIGEAIVSKKTSKRKKK
jgi:hypothetical protein